MSVCHGRQATAARMCTAVYDAWHEGPGSDGIKSVLAPRTLCGPRGTVAWPNCMRCNGFMRSPRVAGRPAPRTRSELVAAIGGAQAVVCATGAVGFGSNGAAAVDEKVRKNGREGGRQDGGGMWPSQKARQVLLTKYADVHQQVWHMR